MGYILDAVLPVFAIIAVGYLAGRKGWLGAESAAALNKFVFLIALPALLFTAMAKVDVATVLNGPYIGAYVAGQLVTFGLGMVLARTFFKRSIPEAATFGTAAIYGNVGYMGIPLVLVAFGSEMLAPAIISTVINGALNIAILTVCIELGGRPSGDRHVGQEIGRIIGRNPILVAPIIGLGVSALGVSLPTPVATFGDILGAAAGPCALFSLGLFLSQAKGGQKSGDVGAMVTLKLIIHPLLTAGFALIWLADQPLWAAVCVLMAALPTGANLYILVEKYGVYVDATSRAILASTVISVVTLAVYFIGLMPLVVP